MEFEALAALIAGPCGGLVVAVYFLRSFISFQKDTIQKVLDSADEDRELFRQALTKIDIRLQYLEKLVERQCEK
jgi:divalent metal cation (Fe/Co/Zn/Cd) transporter